MKLVTVAPAPFGISMLVASAAELCVFRERGCVAHVRTAYGGGGTSYLVKPVDLDLLHQELRLALGPPGD